MIKLELQTVLRLNYTFSVSFVMRSEIMCQGVRSFRSKEKKCRKIKTNLVFTQTITIIE